MNPAPFLPLCARAAIVATGSTYPRLGVPGEEYLISDRHLRPAESLQNSLALWREQ